MSTHERIRVSTRYGNHVHIEVAPIRREGVWALHESVDGGGAWTVTHAPTGRAIGGANDFDREEANRLFDLLVARAPDAMAEANFAGIDAPEVKNDALRKIVAKCVRDVILGAPVGSE
jgi:hypothetical protein